MVSASIRGYFELTRPVNSIAAGVLTFIGVFVAGGLAEAPIAGAAAIVATVLGTASGMAINDYFDREIDRINRPDRPIPRGAVSPIGALVFGFALLTAAVILALTLPLAAIAIAGINLLALVSYTEVFKGTFGLGNLLVAYLVGSAFLFGAAAVGNLTAVTVLFLLAALATLSREIVKDVEDIDGDRSEGLRTLPIVIGERNALRISAVVLVVAIIASPLPYLSGQFGLPYLLVVFPAVVFMLLTIRRSFQNPALAQRQLKYGMFIAVVAFIVGRLSMEVSADTFTTLSIF